LCRSFFTAEIAENAEKNNNGEMLVNNSKRQRHAVSVNSTNNRRLSAVLTVRR